LVFEWCSSKSGASLQALKPDQTHIISCRNIVSIEHTAAGAVFVAFRPVLQRKKRRNLYGLVKSI